MTSLKRFPRFTKTKRVIVYFICICCFLSILFQIYLFMKCPKPCLRDDRLGFNPEWNSRHTKLRLKSRRKSESILLQTHASENCFAFTWLFRVKAIYYKVYIVNRSVTINTVVGGNESGFRQCDLDPFVGYKVTVTAYGLAPIAHLDQVTREMWTQHDTPPFPEIPRIKSVRETSVTLELAPIVHMFGPISAIEIRIRKGPPSLKAINGITVQEKKEAKAEKHRPSVLKSSTQKQIKSAAEDYSVTQASDVIPTDDDAAVHKSNMRRLEGMVEEMMYQDAQEGLLNEVDPLGTKETSSPLMSENKKILSFDKEYYGKRHRGVNNEWRQAVGESNEQVRLPGTISEHPSPDAMMRNDVPCSHSSTDADETKKDTSWTTWITNKLKSWINWIREVVAKVIPGLFSIPDQDDSRGTITIEDETQPAMDKAERKVKRGCLDSKRTRLIYDQRNGDDKNYNKGTGTPEGEELSRMYRGIHRQLKSIRRINTIVERGSERASRKPAWGLHLLPWEFTTSRSPPPNGLFYRSHWKKEIFHRKTEAFFRLYGHENGHMRPMRSVKRRHDFSSDFYEKPQEPGFGRFMIVDPVIRSTLVKQKFTMKERQSMEPVIVRYGEGHFVSDSRGSRMGVYGNEHLLYLYKKYVRFRNVLGFYGMKYGLEHMKPTYIRRFRKRLDFLLKSSLKRSREKFYDLLGHQKPAMNMNIPKDLGINKGIPPGYLTGVLYDPKRTKITIGDNRDIGGFLTLNLEPSTQYEVTVVVLSTVVEETKYSWVSVNVTTGTSYSVPIKTKHRYLLMGFTMVVASPFLMGICLLYWTGTWKRRPTAKRNCV